MYNGLWETSVASGTPFADNSHPDESLAIALGVMKPYSSSYRDRLEYLWGLHLPLAGPFRAIFHFHNIACLTNIQDVHFLQCGLFPGFKITQMND